MGTDSITLECQENDKVTTGSAIRRDLTSGERLLRSFRSIAIFWIVALLSVFVPVLHFILVPLFIILGIVFGIMTFLQSSLILSGTVLCPSCKAEVQLVPNAESWPREQRCTSCYLMLKIYRSPLHKLDASK